MLGDAQGGRPPSLGCLPGSYVQGGGSKCTGLHILPDLPIGTCMRICTGYSNPQSNFHKLWFTATSVPDRFTVKISLGIICWEKSITKFKRWNKPFVFKSGLCLIFNFSLGLVGVQIFPLIGRGVSWLNAWHESHLSSWPGCCSMLVTLSSWKPSCAPLQPRVWVG